MQYCFIIKYYNLIKKNIVEKKLNKNGDMVNFLQKNRAKP